MNKITWVILNLLLTVACSAQGQNRMEVVQRRGGLPNVFAKLRAGKPITPDSKGTFTRLGCLLTNPAR